MIERINLLPSKQHGLPATGSDVRWFLLASAMAAVLIVALGTREILHRGTLEKRRNEILSERDRLIAGQQNATAAVGRLQALVAEKAALQARLDALAALQRERRPWSELLVRISRLTPEGLWLTSLSTEQGEDASITLGLRFQGRALSHDRVAELLGALERDQVFQEVELISTTKGSYLDREVVDFNLSCQVRAH